MGFIKSVGSFSYLSKIKYIVPLIEKNNSDKNQKQGCSIGNLYRMPNQAPWFSLMHTYPLVMNQAPINPIINMEDVLLVLINLQSMVL